MESRQSISHMIIMGDSLSDRGTIYRRQLLGCFPMRFITALTHSPSKRFTNGMNWCDYLSAALANELTIQCLRKKNLADVDIADAIVHQDKKIYGLIADNYNLNDDTKIKYRGADFLRTYNEGGMSSHNYRWLPSKNGITFFTRLLLTNLDEMRQRLLKYDLEHKISTEQKQQTLIIEWSGPNDLITVNTRPTKGEVDLAIKDRIKNVEKLILVGYKHFILFNLPNLALTPRFQEKSKKEQAHAYLISEYFNLTLKDRLRQLQEKFPLTFITIFNTDLAFKTFYENPELFHFDRNKRTKAFVKSKDFKKLPDGTSPSQGYIFWDSVHPSADVHALLAQAFYELFIQHYTFSLENSCSNVINKK